MRVPLIRRWELMQTWLKQDVVTPVQMLAPDGLHMADAGYSLLAHEVAREILAQTQVMAQASDVASGRRVLAPRGALAPRPWRAA